MTDRNRTDSRSYLEVSSRIARYQKGEKSAGASCNTFVVEDSMDSIIEAWAWSAQISKLQGAPTVILSALRPKGTPISSGGFASGPCGYAKVFDATADTMLRPGKKNGVCVLFLDADHPDLDEWLTMSGVLNRAYLGVLFRAGKRYPQEILDKVAEAYNTWHIAYVCKTQLDQNGDTLYPNVCTEIRQKHKGQCMLGALRLDEFPKLSTLQIVQATRSAVIEMASHLGISRENSIKRPDLFSYEPQVGLGFVGMANWIGGIGATYQSLVTYWNQFVQDFGGFAWTDSEVPIKDVISHLFDLDMEDNSPESRFWLAFVSMIAAGDQIAIDRGINRLWTAQPTNHTSLRLGGYIKKMAGDKLHSMCCEDPELSKEVSKLAHKMRITGRPTHDQAVEIMDTLGIPLGLIREIHGAVAAELQPPMAVRNHDGSQALQQSELTGDTMLYYEPQIQTRDEVPYEVYREFCEALQSIMLLNGRCHTFSHNVYADTVDGAFISDFLRSPLGSLYYRLPPSKAQALNKEDTWDDEDLSDLFESNEVPVGFCPIDGSCESCSM